MTHARSLRPPTQSPHFRHSSSAGCRTSTPRTSRSSSKSEESAGCTSRKIVRDSFGMWQALEHRDRSRALEALVRHAAVDRQCAGEGQHDEHDRRERREQSGRERSGGRLVAERREIVDAGQAHPATMSACSRSSPHRPPDGSRSNPRARRGASCGSPAARSPSSTSVRRPPPQDLERRDPVVDRLERFQAEGMDDTHTLLDTACAGSRRRHSSIDRRTGCAIASKRVARCRSIRHLFPCCNAIGRRVGCRRRAEHQSTTTED